MLISLIFAISREAEQHLDALIKFHNIDRSISLFKEKSAVAVKFQEELEPRLQPTSNILSKSKSQHSLMMTDLFLSVYFRRFSLNEILILKYCFATVVVYLRFWGQ